MSKDFIKFDLSNKPITTVCEHRGFQFTILVKQVEVPRWNIFTKLPPKKRYGWMVFVQKNIVFSTGTKLFNDHSKAQLAALQSIFKLTERDQQVLL